MSILSLIDGDDPIICCRIERDGARVGEIHAHAPHAAILRLGERAWWLVDDVAAAGHAAGASLARRVLRQLLTPRQLSLREDGGERLLAQAQRRWRWSTTQDAIALTLGEQSLRVHYLGAWRGRLALERDDGGRLAELAFGGFGRRLQFDRALPLPLAESVFVLYATHRIFGSRSDAGAAS
jgi:hypothetical protein